MSAERTARRVAIDTELLDRALRLGGERTRTATVTAALQEYVARRERTRIVQQFGTLDWDPAYDHKADRRSRDGKLGAPR